MRLGTRASALARWQADWVATRLMGLGVDVELVPITTVGDTQQGPLGTIGGQGLFTKEIQRALLDDRIDLAVHSLKDLPTEEVAGLSLAAVPQRAPVADALICPRHASLEELPPGAVVGTGSLRRRAQLLHVRGDLRIEDIRGNVETRLDKVRSGDFDATILAEAGLRRLGLEDRIAVLLPLSVMMPAIGQGALGLETRSDDRGIRQRVGKLNDPATHQAVLAERAMLAALQGGCLAPIAAWGRLETGRLVLTGRVVGTDGQRRIEATQTASANEAAELGRQVADELLSQGAGDLIQASRQQ
ncbi:MAG: hydroxymethylbilane synthase [Pirellulales bacterium]|nr:hydroxymethylbilane synthase [Pirellulales bacterium]